MPWGVAAGAAIAAGGAYMQSQSAEDAANAQAQGMRDLSADQYAKAQAAAGKVPEFKPVTVTSSFGTPSYTYDANGRLTGISSTAAPWLSSLQQKGQGLAGQYMDLQSQALQDKRLQDAASKAYGAGGTVYDYATQAANQAQGIYGVGQELYGLGRGLAPAAQQMSTTGQTLQGAGAGLYSQAAQAMPTSFDTTQATQDYYNRMQQLVAPQREQQLAATRQGLFNKGRTGLSVGATQAGGTLATNPEMAAYYNAIAQQDLALANQSQQQALSNLAAQTNIGQGLYNTGLNQYNAGLNYGTAGVNTTGTMANILGQGNAATAAGTGQLQAASGLLGQGTALYGSGGNLANQYYTNLTAAQAPFAGQMSQIGALETMQNQPVTQGMQYGGNVTTQANNIAQAYINAAGAGSGAAMSAINAQAQADAQNPWAGVLMGAGQAIGGANWGSLFSGSGSVASSANSPSTASGWTNNANIQYGNTAPMFSNTPASGWSYSNR